MEKLKSKEFWEAAAARALWTVCETFLGVAGSATLIEQINWKIVLSSAAVAGLISIVKSIMKGLPEVNA